MGIVCPNCGKPFEPPADATGGAERVCPHCRSSLKLEATDATMALSPGEIQKAVEAGEAAAAQPGPSSGPKLEIEGYELIGKLGEGGMGSVFLARQVSLDRRVAVKVLHQQFARDQGYLERFMREAKLVARLDHPNVVRALDAGESGGFYYLTMEYVEGRSLQQAIEEQDRLPEAEALGIAAQILKALEFADGRGIVHRDIKPDNILIDAVGTAKLADLGLAREAGGHTDLTQSGTMMGTPHYMSPEQAEGKRDLDVRSDIYSLGATLFRAVTGKPPFEGQTAAVIVARRLAEPPPEAGAVNPEVSPECSGMIRRMMSRDRNLRHQTPAAVLTEIAAILEKSGSAPPAAAAPEPEPAPKRAEERDEDSDSPPDHQPAPPPDAEKPKLPGSGRKRTGSRNLSVSMPREPAPARRPAKLIAGVAGGLAILGLLVFTAGQWLAIGRARASLGMHRYAEARELAIEVWHPLWSSEARKIADHAALYVDLKKYEDAGNWAVARDTLDIIIRKHPGPDVEVHRRKRALYDYRNNDARARGAETRAGLEPRKWDSARKLYLEALASARNVAGLAAVAQRAGRKSAFCLHVCAGLTRLRKGERTAARREFEAALQRCADDDRLPADLQRAMKRAGVEEFRIKPG